MTRDGELASHGFSVLPGNITEADIIVSLEFGKCVCCPETSRNQP